MALPFILIVALFAVYMGFGVLLIAHGLYVLAQSRLASRGDAPRRVSSIPPPGTHPVAAREASRGSGPIEGPQSGRIETDSLLR